MQKKLKILSVLLISLILFSQFVYATDIDPDALSSTYNSLTNTSLGNQTSDSNSTLNTSNTSNTLSNSTVNNTTNSTSNSTANTTSNSSTVSNSVSSTPSVTSNSSLPEADLGFTTILNIVLIVIGALLFFLGIAILVRLK